MEGTEMTGKPMSATERQAAQLEGSTDAYEERVRKQIADDRARFEPASQATRRQVEALGRSHGRRADRGRGGRPSRR